MINRKTGKQKEEVRKEKYFLRYHFSSDGSIRLEVRTMTTGK